MGNTKLKEAIKQELKRKLQEGGELLDSQPETQFDMEDQIGNFWIVKKTMKESTEDDIVCETDIFGLAEMINNGELNREDISGIYQMENKARRAALRGVRERDKGIKEEIKEGSNVKKQLEDSIKNIKLDIQARTQEGIDNPGSRDSVSSDISNLYSKLDKQKELLTRLENSLDKETGTKDETKEA